MDDRPGRQPGRHPPRRAEEARDGRPRHRSRPGQHRLRRRRTALRAAGGARRRRHRDARRGRARAPPRAAARPRQRPAGDPRAPRRRPRSTVFWSECRHSFRRRAGPRRRAGRRRAARRAVLRLHAPAGQGRRLRQRPRPEGPGAAHGADAPAPALAAAARPRRRRARGRDLPRQPRPDGALRLGRGARPWAELASGGAAGPRPAHVVVETAGGVGYRLAVSGETLRHVPGVGRTVTLHAHLVVRDDALALYGFHSEEERDLFLLLLGVQSVGPKVALAVLGGGPPRELVRALAAGDTARLQAVPGIGKRTAERIVVELREKVGVPEAGDAPIVVSRADDPRRVARDGLLELGFAPAEAQALLDSADGDTAEELLASALRAAGG